MAHMNVFDADAFTLQQMIGALDLVDYKPGLLGSMNLFEPEPLRGTDTVTVEKRAHGLSLVPVTQRGAPGTVNDVDKRTIRAFPTRRLYKSDRIQASELFKIRAFGTESEIMQVAAEVNRRQSQIRDDIELTWEFMRLGAVQGNVVYPDGSYVAGDNWYTEWGIGQASEIDFELDDSATDVRGKCASVIRAMAVASKGAMGMSSTVHALCGDEFFDDLTNHSQVRQTYLNWAAAADLRQDLTYQAFSFAGITFHNYRGTDDGTTVAISSTKAAFFPVGARGVFKVAWAPGETFSSVDMPGQPIYPVIEREARADPRWADIEMYSYPLFMCLRPEILQRAKNQ